MARRLFVHVTGWLSFVLVFVLLSGFACADTYMKQKQHTDGYKMRDREVPARDLIQITWMATDKIRHDNEKQSVIVRLDKMEMIMIDHPTMSYHIMPMGEEAASGREGDSGMTREQRRAFGRMGRDTMKMTVEVTDTGEQKKIGKWMCRKYIQEMKTMAGDSRSEVWATQDLKMDYDLFARLSVAMSMPMSPRSALDDAAQEMKKIKGVPVLTISSMDMREARITSTQELIELKEARAPEGTFDVPKDYKKKSF